MGHIPFTQFILPDGHEKTVWIDRPEEIREKACAIMARGLRFECEILTTGDCSFTITDPEKGDLAIETCKNGPDVPGTVDRLISKFYF